MQNCSSQSSTCVRREVPSLCQWLCDSKSLTMVWPARNRHLELSWSWDLVRWQKCGLRKAKLLHVFIKSFITLWVVGWHLLVTQQDCPIWGLWHKLSTLQSLWHREEVVTPQMSLELFINMVPINFKLAIFNLGLKIDQTTSSLDSSSDWKETRKDFENIFFRFWLVYINCLKQWVLSWHVTQI